MAKPERRLPDNAAGDFYVDRSCIDCGTCRQVAPAIFAEGRDASYVARQPADAAELHRARMALVACPVAAIGSVERHPMQEARAAFPEHLDGGVYYCGYAAEASFGARSYLIVRPQGNILVDSPRYSGPLIKRIKVLGGARWMFLTHQDDVADHRKFHELFGCERILHRSDVTGGTAGVERLIDGTEPIALDEEVSLIPVPGHTAGSTCLLYRNRFLFTGDHAWWDGQAGRVVASRSVCWYDWRAQASSMRRLAALEFEWLLPGHGTRGHAAAATMRREMGRCADRMEEQA